MPVLYNGVGYAPPQNFPFQGDPAPTDKLLLGPTPVHNPNSISICSAVFAGLAVVSNSHMDTQMEHATSIAIGWILCFAL